MLPACLRHCSRSIASPYSHSHWCVTSLMHWVAPHRKKKNKKKILQFQKSHFSWQWLRSIKKRLLYFYLQMCVCMTTATNFPTLIQSSPIHRPAYDISPESASVPDFHNASFTGEHKIGLLSPVHMGCYLFPMFWNLWSKTSVSLPRGCFVINHQHHMHLVWGTNRRSRRFCRTMGLSVKSSLAVWGVFEWVCESLSKCC